MKSYILMTICIAFGLFTGKSLAQILQEPEKRNYVVITRNIEQIKPVIHTAKELSKEDGKNFGELQVVICGKTVMDLTQEDKILPYMEAAEKEGVKLIACGFSLKKFDVSQAAISKKIKVVETGSFIISSFRKRAI